MQHLARCAGQNENEWHQAKTSSDARASMKANMQPAPYMAEDNMPPRIAHTAIVAGIVSRI
jgi:hypothetical protein